jgi:hypothetical protein
MDSLIRAAWIAFWIGLGASAVLIGQPLLAEPAVGAAVAPAEPAARPPFSAPAPPPAPLRGPEAMSRARLTRRWRVQS